MPRPRRRPLLATAGALALILLHLAPGWIPALRPGPSLVLNVLPAELAYRLGWMGLALAYLVLLTSPTPGSRPS